jgi:F-type H+-transporting ATPase subunit a
VRLITTYFLSFILCFAAIANPVSDNAAENANAHIAAKESKEENVIETIMNHVADANENHITTIGENHITLPLPCILYDKTAGKFTTCMSSVFHHGHKSYNGYVMDHGRVKKVTGDFPKEAVDVHVVKEKDAKGKDLTVVEYNGAKYEVEKASVIGGMSSFIDFSITKNVLNMLLAFVILTVVFFSIKKAYTTRASKAPKGIQSVLEPVIQYLIDDVMKPNLGDKYITYLPYILSVFFFILVNNLLGLIPFIGGINSSGNIAFTMVLAFCSLLLINLSGNKNYWQHIFAMPGVPKWVLVILTPIELLGVLLKPAVLMLRLFGNITGGHIAVLSIVSLIFIMGKMGTSLGGAAAGGIISIPILLFVNAMELFVAFLQAYVFTLLTTIFIGAAIEDHHHATAEHH